MAEKRSKYDTDPLDPDFAARRAAEMGRTTTGETTARPTGQPPLPPEDETRRLDEATRQFNETTQRFDEPTRRLESDPNAPYPSVFAPQFEQPRANGQNPNAPPNPPPAFGAPPQTPYANPNHTAPFTPHAYAPPVAPPAAGASPYVAPPQYPSPSRPVAKIGLPENVACMLPYAPFYIGVVVSLIELLIVPRQEVRTRFHAAQGLALHAAIFVIARLFTLLGFETGYHIGGLLFGLASFIYLIISMVRAYKGSERQIAPLADLTKWLNQRIEPRI